MVTLAVRLLGCHQAAMGQKKRRQCHWASSADKKRRMKKMFQFSLVASNAEVMMFEKAE
jgi:hypothetical protein